MNIQDYSPRLAISVQREIIENQRTTIEYWRGQVADRDERIKALEAALDVAREAIASQPIDAFGSGSDNSGLVWSIRDELVHNITKELNAQKGGGNG